MCVGLLIILVGWFFLFIGREPCKAVEPQVKVQILRDQNLDSEIELQVAQCQTVGDLALADTVPQPQHN